MKFLRPLVKLFGESCFGASRFSRVLLAFVGLFSLASTVDAATVVAPTFSPVAGTYTSVQSVTIASTTSGASIRYTTDGSTPSSTAGTLYSSPVSIGATVTLKAIAFKSGSTDSSVTSGAYTINLPVAAPTFSPVAGTYTSAQTVAITSTTSGASIRYTTDGSTPSATAGTLYSAPISIAATTTLKGIAYKSGSTNSSVISGIYTINLPVVATPTFSPVAGTYTSAQTVAITSTTSGASIRYTTDGSTPSATAGTLYAGSISIGVTTTLKAIAYKSGSTNSSVISGIYTINLPVVATPTFSPVAGTYTSVQNVSITSATSGASIRYTTDGSTPSATVGTLYGTTPVAISVTTTLKAIAFKTGSTSSGVASGLYTINLPVVVAPTFNPVAGTYASAQNVTIASATSGASIRYTTDGSTPSATVGTLYGTTPVAISVTTTVKAIAYKSGSTNSSVTSGTYTINLPVVATPTFSVAAGTYTSIQTVTIASTTSGSSIRYTTDGSTPSATDGTLYSAPVSIATTTTLKAIAYKTGSTNSSVFSATYTINLPAVITPTFNPAAGIYTGIQNVTITSGTSGASIRYTTDGSTPSATTGTLYSSQVNVATTTTLKAIAFKTGSTNSGVFSGTYTINLPPVATPTFSLVGGTYPSAVNVTLASSTSGASIRYTTDGSTPSATAGTLYSVPVNITATTTLKVIAFKAGMADSAVVGSTYTITVPAPVITSPTTATGKTGTSFNYQITATNNPTGFGATGLPTGLSVNTTTGLISGTPTVVGISTVNLTATNGGGTGPANLTLTLLASLPYIADFETAEGYGLGSLSGRLGWLLSAGTGLVTAQDFYHGSQSVQLPASTPVALLTQSFGNTPGEGIVFFDFFAKPVAESDPNLATTFSVEQAKFAFKQSGSVGTLQVFKGNGAGGGSWSPTKFSIPLGVNNQAQAWLRLTTRLDFGLHTWDLYANGNMVAADVGALTNTSYLSAFQVKGDAVAASGIDYIYAGPSNTVFVDDTNNNGIQDSWETAYGLSLQTNNRNLSLSGNGTTVIQAYVNGTDPRDSYNGGPPTLAILGGNNQVTPASQFNPLAFDIGVWNADGTAPLVNASIAFTVQSGGGKLALTKTGNPALANTLSLTTDVNGTAQVYYQQPAAASTASVVKLTAGTSEAFFNTSSAASVDSDHNGLNDSWEILHFGHLGVIPNADPDNDGLTNLQEFTLGTDPNLADTDGDGVRDGLEVSLGMNPLVADGETLPVKIGGLKLLLDADAGVAANANGDINFWNDQSGQGNNAAQSVVGYQPTLITNSLNGHRVVRFNLGGRCVTWDNNFLSGVNAAEVFVVLKANSDDSTSHGLWSMSSSGAGAWRPYGNGHDIYENFGSDVRPLIGSPTQSLMDWSVYNITTQNGSWVSRTNGLAFYQRATNTVGFSNPLILGRNIEGGSYAGDIASVLIYNRALNAEEREAVHTYLARKYALFPAPVAPSSLNTTAVGGTQASVTWTGPGRLDQVVYELERKQSGGSYTKVGEVTGLSYLDSGLIAGETYTYRVRMRAYSGTSDYSNEASIKPVGVGLGVPASGLCLWLKADSISLPNASAISSWSDQSGQGHDAIQSITSYQPTLITNSLNGRQAVRFNLGGRCVTWDNNFLSGVSAAEVFVVLKANSDDSTSHGLWSMSSSGAGAWRPYGNGHDIYENFGSDVRPLIGSPTQSLMDWSVYNITTQNGSWVSRTNGLAFYQRATNTVGFSNPLILGRNIEGGSYAGDIAEVLIYNRALSADEREAVHTYLGGKYALYPAPVAPSSLAVTIVGGTQASVTWTSPSRLDQVVYELERKQGGGSYSKVGEVTGLSYLDSGLIAGETYTYRVRMRAYSGTGGYSDEVSVVAAPTGTGMPAAGMRLWLSANAGMIKDPSGNINLWTDQSGKHNDAIQTEVAKRPLVVANVVNGRPVVHFDGGKSFNLSNLMDGAQAGEAFVFLKVDQDPPPTWRGLWGMGGGSYTYYPYMDGAIYEDWGSSVRRIVGNPVPPLDQFHLYNVSSQSGQWSCRINGNLLYGTTDNTVFFRPDPVLGTNSTGANNPFLGDIAEAIIYDRVLTSQERDAVGSYFTAKYAPPSIPVPTAPTNLSAVAASASQISLVWTDQNAGLHSAAVIERRTGAAPFIVVGEQENGLGYTDSGLTLGVTYNYRVKLRSYAGSSDYSNIASATPSSGIAQVPSGGLRLWLKADLGTQGSGPLSTWTDQSGSGKSASQPSASKQPQVIANALNGWPVVRFDGASSYLSLPNVMDGSSAAEIIAVVRAPEAGTRVDALWQFGTSYGSLYYNGYRYDDFGTNNGNSYGGPPAAILAQYHYYNVSINEGTWIERVNGLELLRRTGQPLTFRSDPMIGRTDGGSYLKGDIAEIIIYDHQLTSAEREEVGVYLTAKYAPPVITLPATPAGLVAAALSSTQISVAWNVQNPGVHAVAVIERQTGSGPFEAVGEEIINSGYTDSGLTAGVTYTYRVKMKGFAGSSGYSGTASATTLANGAGMPTTGLRLWLRSDVGTQGEGPLKTWTDQSGLGNDATQTVSSSQPRLLPGIINGWPGVRFSGAENYLNLPYFMNGASSAELFVVLKNSAAYGGSLLAGVGASDRTIYPNGTGQISDGFGSTSSYKFSVNGADLAQARLYNVTAAANFWTAALDGKILYTAVSGGPDFTNGFFTPLIGADHGGAYLSLVNFFQGDIAEILIYDHSLTMSERLAVGSYLKNKFNLSIAPVAKPTAFAARDLSPSKVSLSWSGDSSSQYTLQRSKDGGATWQTVITLNGQTSYTDSGLTAATTYLYRVNAINYAGTSEYSTIVSATTLVANQAGDLPVAGLALWLKPEDLVASNGGLALWPDRSGLGNDAGQVSSLNRPQVVAGAINGQPAARFDGTASYLNLPYLIGTATSAELFVVLKSATSNRASLISAFGASAPTRYPDAQSWIADGFGASAYHTFDAHAADLTQPHVYNVSAAADSWTASLDGGVLYQTAVNTVDFTNGFFAPIIGADHGGAYLSLINFFQGDVAEVIIYNRALSPAERESVNHYLNQRYNLSPKHFTDLSGFAYDSDGDGLSNSQEATLGTNPYLSDTDGDGIPDAWEVAHGLNPLANDSQLDPDGDGLTNFLEYLRGTDPHVAAASDPAASVNLVIFQPSVR